MNPHRSLLEQATENKLDLSKFVPIFVLKNAMDQISRVLGTMYFVDNEYKIFEENIYDYHTTVKDFSPHGDTHTFVMVSYLEQKDIEIDDSNSNVEQNNAKFEAYVFKNAYAIEIKIEEQSFYFISKKAYEFVFKNKHLDEII